jgi:hypothetical protein
MQLLRTLLLFAIPTSLALAEGLPPPSVDDMIAKIRPDRPRLFINQDTLPGLRDYAQSSAKNYLSALLRKVDAYEAPEELEFRPEYVRIDEEGRMVFIRNRGDQNACEYGVKIDGGFAANECALAWLITGKEEYRLKAIASLRLLVKFVQLADHSRILPNWYNYSRCCGLVAYDWLFDTLTPEERKEILLPLLRHVKHMQSPGYLRNSGGPDSGYYGEPTLRWYAGLVGYKAGVDDALAEELLRAGYEHYVAVMQRRDNVSGGKGLLISITVGYSLGAYPWASYNFLHSLRAACDIDGRQYWVHMRDYANFFNWMSILGADGRFYDFGWGDASHNTNVMGTGLMYTHLAQALHFYGQDFPEQAKITQAIMSKLPGRGGINTSSFPFTPFLLTGFDPAVIADASDSAINDGRLGEFFPSFGLSNMRSGFRADATYASFKAGAKYDGHQHYDENSFIIYKHGYQAMDTGTRGSAEHHLVYYPQTIAHNSVLIRMDEEPLARHWYPTNAPRITATVYNDGGQNARRQAVNLGFEQSAYHVVSGGDATLCYSDKKCREAVRQFVYLAPDCFVVYDRVSSVTAEQEKVWLWHSQNEPVALAPSLFRASHGQGAMAVRTLLPLAAKHEVIGGPGKEYWTNGRNWEFVDQEAQLAKPGNQYGRYRLEVSPADEGEKTRFLHFLQVGQAPLPKLAQARLLQSETQDGIEVICPETQRRFQLFFNRDGLIAGHIYAWDADGKGILDQPLLQEQTGVTR